MRRRGQIQIEATKVQKEALTSVLLESGSTITEWFADNIANAMADFSHAAIETSEELSNLQHLHDVEEVLRQLSERDWTFADDDTTYLSHDIHPYPAKFIPQIPRNLIAELSLPGELVWDPFGGSGTTALEAVLLGRQAVSSDVNPLAEIIGKGKLLTLTKEDDEFISSLIQDLFIVCSSEASTVEALHRYEKLCDLVPQIPNVSDWFHPHALSELAYIKARIQNFESEKCKRLATVCLSKIILKSSFQDSETRYARCERDFPRGKVIRLFAGALESSLKKVRYLGTFLRFREARFVTADLRNDNVVKPNSVDLIVTSPPYSNTNDYHLYHRFRLFWLGYDPRDLAKREIGSHLRHQKEKSGIGEYIDEIQQCLVRMFRGLRPGRFAVIVVGNSLFKGTVFQNAELISQRAKSIGFEVVGKIDRELPKHKRSFISPARRLRAETLLVLRKASEKVFVRLYSPPYRLWPFEAAIREYEIERLVGSKPNEELEEVLTVEISPLQIDQLRRLTFSHSFAASNISEEPTWQAILENGEALRKSVRKDPKYVTHGIHAYKGKFYPQLAKSLFNLAGLKSGQRVLDPFCGSGTVPLEAYLNGFEGLGMDMNPLAVKIARAKTQILLVDPYFRDRLLAQFAEHVERLKPSESLDVFDQQAVEEIKSWFPSKVIGKVSALLQAIGDVPEVRVKEFLEILLSNIVRQISHQDPRDLRIRRRATPLEDAPVFSLFEKQLALQRNRLAQFASRSNRAPTRFVPSRIWQADSRDRNAFESAYLDRNSIDAIITSPPYATALPYIDTDRLSILLLFGLPAARRVHLERSLIGSREILKGEQRQLEEAIEANELSEVESLLARKIISTVHKLNKDANVGFRRKNMASLLLRYFSDMAKVFKNLDTYLKPGGAAYFVIGDNVTIAGTEEFSIKSGDVLVETAELHGWQMVKRIPITVTKENRPHAKHSITRNEIICCQKPKP